MTGIAKYADVEKLERTPLADRGLPPDTYAALERGAARNPDATALTFVLKADRYDRATRYTFRELMAGINRAANAFRELGIGPNDVVSILMPNAPETHFAFWGAEAVGIANPINPLLEVDQIAEIMRAAGAKVLVTLAPLPGTDLWAKANALRGKVPTLETILQVDLADHLSGPASAIVRALMAAKRAFAGGPGRVIGFHSALAGKPTSIANRPTGRGEAIAAYFHTGGTTGAPKLAKHTHRGEVFDAWSASQCCEVSPENVFLCGLPLFHVNGVIVTGLMPWMNGASVVIVTPQGYRGPHVLANFWKIVERYRVSFFSAVPAVYTTLLQNPIAGADVSSLRFAISGAAALPRHVCSEFEARTGLKILEGYGLTEGTCVSAVNPAYGERRNGSVGFRLPYQEMKVVVVDEAKRYLRDAGADEIGEIVIRGPNVFAGYADPAHEKETWIDLGDGKPWLRTGDLGRRDAEGYFWLTGRKKELIIRGGHNIDPRSIEEPIQSHPAVAMVAAVGRPEPRVGEVPVAYVALKPGRTAAPEELLAHASSTIRERAAIPKAIYVVDSLPLTAIGKIYKPELLNRQIEEVFHGDLRTVEELEAFTLAARPHPSLGTLVRVSGKVDPAKRKDAEAKIREKLGQYSIAYELEF